MGIKKLKEVQGRADLGVIRKVKRGKNKRSNDGSNLDPLTNDLEDGKGGAHILAKLDLENEPNRERSIGTGDRMKEKKDKYKNVNDLRLSEKTFNDKKVNCGSNFVAVEPSKDNDHESNEHGKEDDTKEKSSRHNRSEKLTSSANFYDEGMSCSENRDIDVGFKESRKYKSEQKKEKKKGKQKGITDFNSLKNASTEVGANLEDEIIRGGLMGSEKDQKKQRNRKGSYKESENSTTCTDNCNWNENKEQDKKRKRKDYFLELEQGPGSLKEMTKEASGKACKFISRGDADEVPSRTHISNKKRKREMEKENAAGCPVFTIEMTARKAKDDQRRTDATTNYVEKNKSDMNTLHIGKGSSINESSNHELMKDARKGKKKVSFSNEVKEFPLAQFGHEELGPDNLVWGRYTPEEDELIRKAIMNYIEANQLGEKGLHMILHCRSYREVKGCWKEISAALPWRPYLNTYVRAHNLFERSEERKWEPEELELLRRYYAEHGPKWRKLADILGKSRIHVKDAWRRIRLPNQKKGKWSQVEYQSLFDLVNLNLRMKAFEEKKVTHCVVKDNISWEAISDKMVTRGSHACCRKWYYQLTSSMVQEGKWSNLDDYKLIEALQKTDICCFEEVDWDNLLEHRSGEMCQKRWYEMVRRLDRFWVMSFVEQVDVLSQRYCSDVITYRENDQKT